MRSSPTWTGTMWYRQERRKNEMRSVQHSGLSDLKMNGDDGIRTHGPRVANAMLSH